MAHDLILISLLVPNPICSLPSDTRMHAAFWPTVKHSFGKSICIQLAYQPALGDALSFIDAISLDHALIAGEFMAPSRLCWMDSPVHLSSADSDSTSLITAFHEPVD